MGFMARNTIMIQKKIIGEKSKGRCAGSKNRGATINEIVVYKIISLLLNGYSVKEISKTLEVSKQIIYKIKNKKTWKHITKDIEFAS